MKEGQLKGRLVAFLPVAGVLAGLLAGTVIEWLQLRYGALAVGPWTPWIIGGGTGLVCGVVSAVLCWLLLDRYLRELRAPLTELSSLPFGPSTEQHNDPTRSTAEGLRTLAKRLVEVKQRLDRVRDRIGELAAGREDDDRSDEKALEELDQRREQLASRRRKLEELKRGFDERVKPVFDLEFAPIKLPGVVDFERMVSFHARLEEELDRQLEGWDELSSAVDPLGEAAPRMRAAVESANELLLEMSDLFRQFPQRDLPRRAEELRQHTLEWNQLAERIEEGLEAFEKRVRQRRDQLGDMKQQVEKARGPEETWNEVKEELSRVDTIVRQIREAIDGEWADETTEQLAWFRNHADGWVELLEEMGRRLRNQHRRIRELEDLLRDVESLGQGKLDAGDEWTSARK